MEQRPYMENGSIKNQFGRNWWLTAQFYVSLSDFKLHDGMEMMAKIPTPFQFSSWWILVKRPLFIISKESDIIFGHKIFLFLFFQYKDVRGLVQIWALLFCDINLGETWNSFGGCKVGILEYDKDLRSSKSWEI